VASTWRDPAFVDPFGIPLRMEQLICLVIAVVALALAGAVTARDAARRRRRSGVPPGTGGAMGGGGTADSAAGGVEPSWPNPEDRPFI
jgi:hypothetical protein